MSLESPDTSLLSVEAPHDSVSLAVYDATGQCIDTGLGRVQTSITAGIYEVSATWGGVTQRELVVVRPTLQTTVASGAWKGFEFPSAAPLTATTTSREGHQAPAEKWSRQLTTPSSGPSRLFIFLRAIHPQHVTSFQNELQLLDVENHVVTGFQEGVASNLEEGWLAFCADLEPGPYVLRSGRQGVPLRFQPIWLSRGYETQLFVPVERHPSLKDLALFVTRRGRGFRSDDEEALLVEALLNDLELGRARVSAGMVQGIVERTADNPWLSIVVAHALLLSAMQKEEKEQAAGATRQVADLLARLDASIADHPDVRALHLGLQAAREEPGAAAPFDHPPLLWAGLKLVQQRAIRDDQIIPDRSLTARLLEDALVDSPWVAWRSPRARAEARIRTKGELRSLDDLSADSWAGRLFLPELVRIARSLSDRSTQEEGVIRFSFDPLAGLDATDSNALSQALSLPISHVERAIARLKAQPFLMEQIAVLSPVEQAVATALQGRRRMASAGGRESISLSQMGEELTYLAKRYRHWLSRALAEEKESLQLSLAGGQDVMRSGAAALGYWNDLRRLASRLYESRHLLGQLGASMKKMSVAPEAILNLLEALTDQIRFRASTVIVTDALNIPQYVDASLAARLGHDPQAPAWDGTLSALVEQARQAGNNEGQLRIPGTAGEVVTWDVLRAEVEDNTTFQHMATLYHLREAGYLPLAREIHLGLQESVNKLTLYLSLLENGTKSRRREYLYELLDEALNALIAISR